MRHFKTLLPLAVCALSAAAHADLVSFSDDFSADSTRLNAVDLTHWDVTGGTVDVLGPGLFDFYPGHNNYIDLDGSSANAGTMTTKEAFAPGTYTLAFTLGRNPTDANVVQVRFGSFAQDFSIPTGTELTTYSFTANLASSGKLSFHNLGGDNYGAILDDVRVTPQATPEPSSIAAVAAGGFALLRRRKARARL